VHKVLEGPWQKLAAVVAVIGLGFTIYFGFSSLKSATGTTTSTTSGSPTATALGTPTSSATTLTIYYQGPVTIAGNGRDFDTNPPSPGPGAGAFYYNSSALETGGSSTAGLAVWRQGGSPTAAECRTFANANLIIDVPNINAGMKLCFKTDQGRFGLLSVQPGTSANELTAIATVWDH
jgi:hypothetical protein